MRLLAGAVLALSFLNQTAFACPVCAAADTTIPALGAEGAYKNRVRVATDARVAAVRSLADPSVTVDERRLELFPSWAPSEDFLLSAGIPIVWRNIGPATEAALGDLELRATVTLFQRVGPVRQRAAFFGGFRAPTAPLQRDALGRYLPTDLQPGCGSVVTMAGGFWTIGRGDFTLTTTASILLPSPVRDGPHPGTSLRAGLTGQFQPKRWIGLRLGAQARYDTQGAIGNVADPRSGGAVLFVVPELVVSPANNLALAFGASFPAAQELQGYRVVGPVALLSASYDF